MTQAPKADSAALSTDTANADGTADSGAETGTAAPPRPTPIRGYFERPLFDAEAIRGLQRVGVIDVGSNSVRMVVFDGAARSPAYFYNEKLLCGLGRGLAETGLLNPEGRVRALNAINRFSILAEEMDLTSLTMVATAAVREATDGEAFKTEVEMATGIEMRIIDGEEEARLSAQGVLLGWPGARGLVCDIGGSSMELGEVADNTVGRRATSPLGPFRLQQIKGGKKGLKNHIRETLTELRDKVGGDHKALYLVGGSWRALARLDMERRGYPLTVLHEYEMTPKSIRKTIDWLQDQDLSKLRNRTGTSAERMSLVPLATVVLRQLLHVFRPKRVYVSSYGIREGILFEQMPDDLRACDPLIEASRHLEEASARTPGFGRKLFDFLMPLYRNAPPDRMRLIRAACLLHDVNWRAHPDYRSESCFDTATRANLGGMDHKSRVYLGLALMNRYKNPGSNSRLTPLLSLLDPEDIRHANMLGRAMRFGAMLSVKGPNAAAEMRYYPKKEVLELILDPDRQALFGEVAQQRFSALAKSLGVSTKLRVARTAKLEVAKAELANGEAAKAETSS
ncbi:Ppx/GppA family phosphatase [Pararhodobacter oceanensis]|uniref:Exopolyphosphatase n=1 Tax=Pararhodobacter oceanensis TaxID=2172121 RepID=A0A2T8HWF7_9RHOB|nr:Ppx/GppA family phosphatase [Pararhodobacter oceanensis]PVH29771.1 exopolyphosphatase [Pararhodobacter oceanensis]